MTRYLLVGAAGMLATDIAAALGGRDVTKLTRDELDVTDSHSVAAAVEGHDVVVNTAAYTNVDEAESHEPEAHLVNAVGAANLARAAAAGGAALVQFSTDYVFDGTASTPYSENSRLNPVSAYGRTKADGERFALDLNPGRTYVVRTAWLYGRNGNNFAKTMLRLAHERDTVDVVTDQVGQPTWTSDLADQIVAMIDAKAPVGIYHGTNSGEASWYDFARAVFRFGGFDPDRVKPTGSGQFVRPAPRPSYSVLGHGAWERAGLKPMRDWSEALAEAFSTGALGAE
jgi:dTDP-4-dehydrorhamnose reductase